MDGHAVQDVEGRRVEGHAGIFLSHAVIFYKRGRKALTLMAMPSPMLRGPE